MVIIEILISIGLLLLLVPTGFKIGKHFAERFSFNKEKKMAVLKDIQDALQDGLDSLNSKNMSAQEIKKMRIKKDKFLEKASQLITEISVSSGLEMAKHNITDRILGDTVPVDVIVDIKGTTYFPDYQFAIDIISKLVEESEFPKRDDYKSFNKLYKKYLRLNKENKHGK